MEVLRETGPFAIGFLVIWPIVYAVRWKFSDRMKTALGFAVSLLVGIFWSILAGEQNVVDLFDHFVPIFTDTCLAYTGLAFAAWIISWPKIASNHDDISTGTS